MRRHVFLRDDGVCADCGAQHRYLDGDWQADHVKPLFMAFGDRSFWEPTNVQILCTDPCHKRKSAADRVRYERPASTSKSKSQHSKRKNS
jgi:5-methylcytosine-specific restriction endonuclease McrA